jgi:hypothetical protein
MFIHTATHMTCTKKRSYMQHQGPQKREDATYYILEVMKIIPHIWSHAKLSELID